MELFNAIKNSEIFSGLTDEEIEEIAGICNEKTYDNETIIFEEKSTGSEMYILCRGKVDIQTNIGLDTELATVHVIKEGEIFGELSLIDRAPRSATANAAGDAQVFILELNEFEKLVESNYRIGYVIMKNIAQIVSTRLRERIVKYTESLIWKELSADMD